VAPATLNSATSSQLVVRIGLDYKFVGAHPSQSAIEGLAHNDPDAMAQPGFPGLFVARMLSQKSLPADCV
jgi:hypothetical protein